MRSDQSGSSVPRSARLARLLWLFTAVVLAGSLAGTLVWAIATLSARPLDGVEGDVFFEAARIRAHRTLYIDPLLGAHEYGSPPARYLVLYPPLWSAALSLVPRELAFTVGRALASLAWFGGVAHLVWRAPRRHRQVVALAAVFLAGTWVLALYGANARPDALAVLFSGLALERAARLSVSRARIDAIAGALFALAAWTKPNVIGLVPGAFIACMLHGRGVWRERLARVLPGLAGLTGTSAIVVGALHLASNGAWLSHLLASTGQGPSFELWLGQVVDRGPFFLLPLLATLAFGFLARREPGAAIATGALASSVAWLLLSLAKIGSASNYFMEPGIAMLVVLSRAEVPFTLLRFRLIAPALALFQVTWNGVASIRGSLEEIPTAFARRSALERVRTVCGASPSEVILADEPGLELMLNGRIVQTPFQTTHLVRRGRFPARPWLDDVRSPSAACLVMQDNLLERPLTEDDVARDRFTPEMRAALAAHFERVETQAGYFIYRARAAGK